MSMSIENAGASGTVTTLAWKQASIRYRDWTRSSAGHSGGLVQSCYSGVPGTAGVGTCVAGNRTCAFGSFGTCVGEIVNQATDVCCDGLDTDCDGANDAGEGCLSLATAETRLDEGTAGDPRAIIPGASAMSSPPLASSRSTHDLAPAESIAAVAGRRHAQDQSHTRWRPHRRSGGSSWRSMDPAHIQLAGAGRLRARVIWPVGSISGHRLEPRAEWISTLRGGPLLHRVRYAARMHSIATRLEQSMPDARFRERALDIFTASLRYVRARRPEWLHVRFHGQRLRLFAGKNIVLTIEGDRIWLATDGLLSGSWAEPLSSWRWDTKSYPEYRRPLSRNGYYKPLEDDADEWAIIEMFHSRYLDAMLASKLPPLPQTVEGHESGVVDYLVARAGNDVHVLSRAAEPDFGADELIALRQKTCVQIVRRDEQGVFRTKLLAAYAHTCAISGCSVAEVLDAAHIAPFAAGGSNEVYNGLLLRTDLHTLFDLGLLAIDPDSRIVALAPTLVTTQYGALAGCAASAPADARHAPSRRALASRWQQARELWAGMGE